MQIKHNLTIVMHTGKDIADNFYSYAPFHNGYIAAYKIVTKNKPSILKSTLLDTQFRRLHRSFSLGFGEDPRVFKWNGEPFALSWTPHGGDWTHRIINIRTNLTHSLDHCVSTYRGKNWVPLVDPTNRLYIFYRVWPKTLYFEFNISSASCRSTRPKLINKIGEYRGGTAFVQFNSSTFLSIGHRTVNRDRHIPYGIFLNARDLSIPHIVEFNTSTSGILDPSSLWWEGPRLRMGGVQTSKCWGHLYRQKCKLCAFNNSVYDIWY